MFVFLVVKMFVIALALPVIVRSRRFAEWPITVASSGSPAWLLLPGIVSTADGCCIVHVNSISAPDGCFTVYGVEPRDGKKRNEKKSKTKQTSTIEPIVITLAGTSSGHKSTRSHTRVRYIIKHRRDDREFSVDERSSLLVGFHDFSSQTSSNHRLTNICLLFIFWIIFLFIKKNVNNIKQNNTGARWSKTGYEKR